MSTHDPATTASAAVQSLRERIGQENMTQSSVLATRRLDEALLRLDRAAGRTRDDGDTESTSFFQPTASRSPNPDASTSVTSRSGATGRQSAANRPAVANEIDLYEEDFRSTERMQRAGLELDRSVSGNTSIWLESEDTGQQMRMDARHDSPTAPRSVSAHVPGPHHAPPTSKSVPGEASDHATLEALFSQSIDVMILSTTTKILTPQTAPQQRTPDASPEQPATPVEVSQVPAPQVVADVAQEFAAELPATPSATPSALPQVDAETDSAATQNAAPTQDAADAQDAAPAQDVAADQDASPALDVDTASFLESVPVSEPLVPFAAAWQVDEFLVPATIDELFLAGTIAEQLGSRLATAREQGLRTIAITSTQPGEGRSTVAIGMALSVAFSGLRVALVDADREGVRIASDLQLDLDQGWLDAIRGGLPLEEVAVRSRADAVTLLPLLQRADETPFETHELQSCLRVLGRAFDLVVVDCGVGAAADAALCDTALVVRDMQRTKAAEVETLTFALRRHGLHGVGVVENFC